MLTLDQVKTFFIENNIPLVYETFLGRTEINNMFMKAVNIEHSFAGFILYAVINIEKSGINTNFKSWEELFECYCCFMIGYNSNTTMTNN